MNIRSLILIFIVPLLLTACDSKDTVNQPKTQTRSMIIGGMPVNDHDYKILAEQVSVSSEKPKSLNSID